MHWAVTLLLFMFGIPDMVEDYHTWTKWVDVDLPRGIGTVLFLLGVLCFLLTYYRGGERWAIIHLPWIGRWWALRHFRKLESKLDTFSRQDMGFEYAEINELAHMLGGSASNIRQRELTGDCGSWSQPICWRRARLKIGARPVCLAAGKGEVARTYL